MKPSSIRGTSSHTVVLVGGLSFSYRSGRVGLEEVDLEVASGEVLGVIGANGSGKSTLLRLLALELLPSQGSVRILGTPSSEVTPTLRRSIGVAGDEPVHFEALHGLENAVLFARAAGLDRRAARRLALETMARLGLSDVAHVPVSEYSFGMRRKLLLVEALTPVRPLLLLDEPTVGLDPPSKVALAGVISNAAGQGSTVVMASNDVDAVQTTCSRVVMLHAGRIVADDEPRALLARLGSDTEIVVDVREDGNDREGTRSTEVQQTQLDVPGCTSVIEQDGTVRALTDRVATALPALLGQLIERGYRVRQVTVREPSLADVYARATGVELISEPEGVATTPRQRFTESEKGDRS